MQQILNAQFINCTGLHSLLLDAQACLHAVDLDNHPFETSSQTIDASGGWVSPGLVDLQLNGALGVEFTELEPGEGLVHLARISQYLWQEGVSAWLPTLISSSLSDLHQSLEVIERFCPPSPGARILGVHLEGPFLNPEYRGAHLGECLLPLTLEMVKTVLGEHMHLVRMITLAPELDPEGTVIPWLVDRGIFVSLGHTAATFAEAQRAFDQGARLVTHLFNAQRPLHHREPGVAGAALLDKRVHCLCIPDGIHLHPAATQLLLRLKPETHVLPVSDAVAPLGLGNGAFMWHGQPIQVREGRVTLADGRLAGSALSLPQVLARLVHQCGVPVPAALRMTALNPRAILGEPVAPVIGEPADLLLWRPDAPRPVRVGVKSSPDLIYD